MTCDLGRLRGIGLSAALLSACLATCQIALGATAAWWPDWLRNDWGTIEFPAHEAIGSQIAGVLKERRADDRPIGVLLGASYQSFGIDLPALEAQVRPPRKWLRLTVYAGTTCELEPMARLLIEHGRIRPATVVITLGLKMLAHPDAYRRCDLSDVFEIPPRDIVANVRSLRLIVVEMNLESLIRNAFNTLFADRTKINYRVNSRLARVRLSLLERCGQGIEAGFAPSPDPWFERIPKFDREPGESMPDVVARQMEINRREGRLDPTLYAPSGASIRSLIDLIRLVRSTGAEVIVVGMPERTVYRAAVPTDTRGTLLGALKEAFDGESPRFVDLGSLVPDDEFGDMHHLDGRGKTRLTRRLIDELNNR